MTHEMSKVAVIHVASEFVWEGKTLVLSVQKTFDNIYVVYPVIFKILNK